MKVIEITCEPILHGGQERFLFNLIGNIDLTGLQIDVLTPYTCDNEAFKELIVNKGGSLFELNLPFCPGKSRKLLLSPVTKFLGNGGYDVVHIHSGSISALAYSAFAAKLSGIKKIIVHSHSTGAHTLKRYFIRVFFGFMMRMCVTDYLACSLEAGIMKFTNKIVKNNLHIVKNGILVDEYSRDNKKRQMMKNKLGLAENCYTIGHVGRFSKEKNHKFIIDIFSSIVKEVPCCRLLLVGDGELINEIKGDVSTRKLTEFVIFTGNVDNVQDYYQVMDCFILPSVHEGIPFVSLEAQAAGLPCVISEGVPKSVIIGKNVERVPLSDQQTWIQKIVSFKNIRPVDNSEQIRANGYAISDMVDCIRNLYIGGKI